MPKRSIIDYRKFQHERCLPAFVKTTPLEEIPCRHRVLPVRRLPRGPSTARLRRILGQKHGGRPRIRTPLRHIFQNVLLLVLRSSRGKAEGHHRSWKAVPGLPKKKKSGTSIKRMIPPQKNYTFSEFIQWLKDQIENRESQWLEAALKYNDSRQRQGQSIASFLKYLGRWEARLDFTYAQEQRIAHLWAKVLPEIRRESMKFPSRDLQSYASFVSHLKHVECYLQMERSENEGRGGRSKSCDRVNSRPFNKRRSETREYPVLRKSKNKGITKRRK